MKKLNASNKEWWTPERRKEHSIKIKNIERKPRKLPDDFSEKCRQGQIKYRKRKNKEIMENIPFEKWSRRLKIKTLFEENGNKCQRCSFEYTDPETGKGPFQIHHIDGNNTNWKRENIEILCLNCHWATPNFAFRGRTHTKKARDILAEKQRKILKDDAG